MGKEPLIEKWKRGHCAGYRLPEVIAELQRLGFEAEQGTRHWKARHPLLAEHAERGLRVLTFSAHF
ncbi:MAG: hypothetical protein LCH41_12485 [Armatimonadetes bacterium]|nr:hypothetical protein [Armatimonadota bacterium]